MRRWMRRWPTWTQARDVVLFLGGMAGAAHETLLRDAERPWLLLMFAAMMGLPYALGVGRQSQPGPPPGPPLGGDGGSPSSTPSPPQS